MSQQASQLQRSLTSASHPTGLSAKTKKKTPCVICEKVIVEGTQKVKGHDAVKCEGECQGWMHRSCAGLSTVLFQRISDPSNVEPFSCSYCARLDYQNQIQSLKSTIAELNLKIGTLEGAKQQMSLSDVLQSDLRKDVPFSCSSPDQPVKITSLVIPKRVNQRETGMADRKFNIVVYGIEECEAGTKKHERLVHDNHEIFSLINSIDSSIPESSVQDCIRLGSYANDRSRPVLTKLSRTCDVSSILFQRGKLRGSGKAIKADLSKADRQVNRLLMDRRWSLIQSGTDRSEIKIKGGSIFVNKKRLGSVINGVFVEHKLNDVEDDRLSKSRTSTSPPPATQDASKVNHESEDVNHTSESGHPDSQPD